MSEETTMKKNDVILFDDSNDKKMGYYISEKEFNSNVWVSFSPFKDGSRPIYTRKKEFISKVTKKDIQSFNV